MSDKNGWIGNGVEGVSQTAGDWIETVGGLISNTAGVEG